MDYLYLSFVICKELRYDRLLYLTARLDHIGEVSFKTRKLLVKIECMGIMKIIHNGSGIGYCQQVYRRNIAVICIYIAYI